MRRIRIHRGLLLAAAAGALAAIPATLAVVAALGADPADAVFPSDCGTVANRPATTARMTD